MPNPPDSGEQFTSKDNKKMIIIVEYINLSLLYVVNGIVFSIQEGRQGSKGYA